MNSKDTQTRALAIAFFYAIGTAAGGWIAPSLFGALIQTHQRLNVFYGDLVGAILMIIAGVIAIFFAVNAKRKLLESIAQLLSLAQEHAEA